MDINESELFSEKEKKRKKLEDLNKSVLTSLAGTLGEKYNISVVNDDPGNRRYHWISFDNDKVKLKVGNELCDQFALVSFRFLKEPELLDFVMRTITSPDCSVDDYLKLTEMFILKRDIKVQNDYTIDKLLELISQKDQAKYKVTSFCRECRDYYDWEFVYNKYCELLNEGIAPENFYLMSNNMKRAIACFTRVKQGDREAMWQYIRFSQSIYRKGMIDMLKRLALLGDQQAMCELSDSLFTKFSSLKSQIGDIGWHEMAANTGYDTAAFRAGRLYLGSSEDKPHDLDKAAHYLKMAAEKNRVEAMYLLARIYRNPDYADNNLQEAKYWLQLAADKGYKEAKEMLKRL